MVIRAAAPWRRHSLPLDPFARSRTQRRRALHASRASEPTRGLLAAPFALQADAAREVLRRRFEEELLDSGGLGQTRPSPERLRAAAMEGAIQARLQPVLVPYLSFEADLHVTFDGEIAFDRNYLDPNTRRNLSRTDWYQRSDIELGVHRLHAVESLVYAGSAIQRSLVENALVPNMRRKLHRLDDLVSGGRLPAGAQVQPFTCHVAYCLQRLLAQMEGLGEAQARAYLFNGPQERFWEVQRGWRPKAGPRAYTCPAARERPPDKLRIHNLKVLLANTRLRASGAFYLPAWICSYEAKVHGQKVAPLSLTALVNGIDGRIAGVFGHNKQWQLDRHAALHKFDVERNRETPQNEAWQKMLGRLLRGQEPGPAFEDDGYGGSRGRAGARAAPRPPDRGWEKLGDKELLGFMASSPPPSRRDLAVAYRREALRWHPDRCFGMAREVVDVYHARFRRIRSAYETLLKQARNAQS